MAIYNVFLFIKEIFFSVKPVYNDTEEIRNKIVIERVKANSLI